ncbi:MAG: glucosaminidase domain-containing protein [Prevotellaceae bacterium]|jgi:hypothetical protein|nr:glucosaminidase domain-containing protein [Prevotellaceae bacterium]
MKKTIITIAFFAAVLAVSAQNSKKITDYIKQYQNFAIAQQALHGIPASITMAQAILESQSGESMLAQKANNHFGIKCGSNWSGKTINKDDDNIADCFRKYPKVEDSFADHSAFLKRPRYEDLFKIPLQDYKSWAVGLKRAGYATDQNYDVKLVKLIEDYNLNSLTYIELDEDLRKYESIDYAKKYESKFEIDKLFSKERNNGMECYKLKRSATITEISAALKRKNIEKMLYYNDLFEDRELPVGTLIYTEKKTKEAANSYRNHKVQEGESMHLIAQKYGITLKSLYKINKMTYGSIPSVNQNLLLH